MRGNDNKMCHAFAYIIKEIGVACHIPELMDKKCETEVLNNVIIKYKFGEKPKKVNIAKYVRNV